MKKIPTGKATKRITGAAAWRTANKDGNPAALTLYAMLSAWVAPPPGEYVAPSTPADVAACVQMVRSIKGCRSRLKAQSERIMQECPIWAPFLRNWPRLENLATSGSAKDAESLARLVAKLQAVSATLPRFGPVLADYGCKTEAQFVSHLLKSIAAFGHSRPRATAYAPPEIRELIDHASDTISLALAVAYAHYRRKGHSEFVNHWLGREDLPATFNVITGRIGMLAYTQSTAKALIRHCAALPKAAA